jgi:hypothetical protein
VFRELLDSWALMMVAAEWSKAPVPLRQSEINRILGKVDEIDSMEEKLDTPFIVGESVKVMDGPIQWIYRYGRGSIRRKKEIKCNGENLSAGTLRWN